MMRPVTASSAPRPGLEHDVQPAGGAELPAAELGRLVRVEREPGEPLQEVREGDPDQRAGEGMPADTHHGPFRQKKPARAGPGPYGGKRRRPIKTNTDPC
jgi:hypothetical protein